MTRATSSGSTRTWRRPADRLAPAVRGGGGGRATGGGCPGGANGTPAAPRGQNVLVSRQFLHTIRIPEYFGATWPPPGALGPNVPASGRSRGTPRVRAAGHAVQARPPTGRGRMVRRPRARLVCPARTGRPPAPPLPAPPGQGRPPPPAPGGGCTEGSVPGTATPPRGWHWRSRP